VPNPYYKVHDLGVNLLYSVDGDADDLPLNKGFAARDTGVARIRARAQSDLVFFPVIAGVCYPIDVAQLDQSNSTPNTMTIVLLQQTT